MAEDSHISDEELEFGDIFRRKIKCYKRMISTCDTRSKLKPSVTAAFQVQVLLHYC